MSHNTQHNIQHTQTHTSPTGRLLHKITKEERHAIKQQHPWQEDRINLLDTLPVHFLCTPKQFETFENETILEKNSHIQTSEHSEESILKDTQSLDSNEPISALDRVSELIGFGKQHRKLSQEDI